MNTLAFNTVYGYIIVVVVIIAICLICWFVRKRFKIGTYTKEEEKNMKSNLDLLLKEEDVVEGKDYEDEV
ncbi:MAG: hypothetical protein MR270_06250 [Erysipelotrichaceae bacterium]|nr:hypothetical protein [Erysipelotrichaceae bacterium]